MPIYFIGGSPCSGKSSVAEVISRNMDFYFLKVDDHLDKYINFGA